jgi:hypothetical protein
MMLLFPFQSLSACSRVSFPWRVCFIALVFLGYSMMASPVMAQDEPENEVIPELAPANESADLQLELQALRGEINRLHEQTRGQMAEETEILNDRVAALEQRVIGVEERLNSIFLEIRGIEEIAMILLLSLFGVCVITLLSVFVMRRKLIDPVHVQLSRLQAELQHGDAEKTKALQAVLDDMARDDPFVAQLLKKHGLR